jgi:aminoglycoside phosphotransferase (APT) family kinase protein
MTSTIPEITVTVNTVIVDVTGRLVDLLRAEPGFERAELASPPQPLTGGFWASMSVVRLANVAPPADTLVLRVMPDPVQAAKETAFQREITRQGFPAPAIRLSGGADAGLGGAFMLMDLAPGAPALAGLGGIAALRRLPAIARRLPDTLGQVTAALHALDPAPLRKALASTDLTAPCDTPAFLAFLTESADQLGRADLHSAALWLADHPPSPSRHVIAHGDLHPFNVLIDNQRWTLIDWTTALIADPAYDLAFTTLMLRHPPLTAPAPLRPAITAAGTALARQYHAAYKRHGGTIPDQHTLNWHTSLHALRILVELHAQRQNPAGTGHTEHPWIAAGPAAAAALHQTTRITVTSRPL